MKYQKRSQNIVGGLIAAVLLTGIFSSCASVPPEGMGPVRLVKTVDPERYAGRWYEIARFQHSFEKDVYGAAAEYTLKDDGRIQVVNSGFKKSLDGKYTEVKAVAWVPDPNVPAALKVRFFSLFSSDYLIIGLDEQNYRWAIVGDNSRDFLWLLARTPEIDNELYDDMVKIAMEQGFDTSKLFRVPQKAR